MKTGQYWFNFLSDEEKERFKNNFLNDSLRTYKCFNDFLNRTHPTFWHFISRAFEWAIDLNFDWVEVSRREVE